MPDKTALAPPYSTSVSPPIPANLPANNLSNIFLMPVSPFMAHVIWGISSDMLRGIEKQYGGFIKTPEAILRFYYSDTIDSDSSSNHGTFEIVMPLDAQKSYIGLPEAGKSYQAELIVKCDNDHLFPIAKSNIIETARDEPVPTPASPRKTLLCSSSRQSIYAIHILNNLRHINRIQDKGPQESIHTFAAHTITDNLSDLTPTLDLTELCEKKYLTGVPSSQDSNTNYSTKGQG